MSGGGGGGGGGGGRSGGGLFNLSHVLWVSVLLVLLHKEFCVAPSSLYYRYHSYYQHQKRFL